MKIDKASDSVQKVSMVIEALNAGTLKVRKEDEAWVSELLALPRGITGLVNISSLAEKTLAKARATALALSFLRQGEQQKQDSTPFDLFETQCELFRLFEELFVGLTGVASDGVKSIDEIKARMLERFEARDHDFFDDFNAAAGELEEFYKRTSMATFTTAKSLGGVKVVTGGQRHYGSSALAGTRIAGLYCDTQLIPDPVYPFFAGRLHLNAMHLQLAIALFYVFPLRPLIEARLPEPPIVVEVWPGFVKIPPHLGLKL